MWLHSKEGSEDGDDRRLWHRLVAGAVTLLIVGGFLVQILRGVCPVP